MPIINHTYTLAGNAYGGPSEGDYGSYHSFPSPSVYATVTAPSYAGTINPKYIVIGVEYAPPGSSSNVSYTNNTTVGSTTTTSSSFNLNTSTSVSFSATANLAGSFSAGQTYTVSSSYAQQSGTSDAVTVSQTVSNRTGLNGYTDPVTGLNHNYDYIYVWLNPVSKYTVSGSGNSYHVAFDGYGYDLADTRVYNDMDVIGIPMGCLNGYFAVHDPSWVPTCQAIANVYARTWAMNNTDGSGPGLTSTDLQNILQADPFWTSYTQIWHMAPIQLPMGALHNALPRAAPK